MNFWISYSKHYHLTCSSVVRWLSNKHKFSQLCFFILSKDLLNFHNPLPQTASFPVLNEKEMVNGGVGVRLLQISHRSRLSFLSIDTSSLREVLLGKDVYKSCFATSLKSLFNMGAPLQICCIFSEQLFIATPTEGCCWNSFARDVFFRTGFPPFVSNL